MEGTIISAIFQVFTAISSWFTSALTGLESVFFANESLSFIGVLCVCGLGFSVILLVFNIIKDLLHWR